MTKSEVANLMTKLFIDLQETREAGQKEYAHDEDNAFANFERAATDLGIDRKKVLWIFAMKHRDGIVSYLNGHKSQREDVRGRIKDLIVYLILLYSMIEEEDFTVIPNTIRASDNKTYIPERVKEDMHNAVREDMAFKRDR